MVVEFACFVENRLATILEFICVFRFFSLKLVKQLISFLSLMLMHEFKLLLNILQVQFVRRQTMLTTHLGKIRIAFAGNIPCADYLFYRRMLNFHLQIELAPVFSPFFDFTKLGLGD
jgi:hypothetical protein